ncbi:hypothetical protein E4534_24060, partial [Escherichia coli]|nr:hypothetical protein [Escherichia coli]
QKQKKLIMLPSEIMIWQPEFTDKILSRKPGAVQAGIFPVAFMASKITRTPSRPTTSAITSVLSPTTSQNA